MHIDPHHHDYRNHHANSENLSDTITPPLDRKKAARYWCILSIPAFLLILGCKFPSGPQKNPGDHLTIAYNGGPLTVQAGTSAIVPRDIAIVPSAAAGNVIYSIDTPLPGGLVLNIITGTISGTPTRVSAAKTYTIKATGRANTIYQGFDASATISIRVTPADFSIQYVGTFKDVTNTDTETFPDEEITPTTLANIMSYLAPNASREYPSRRYVLSAALSAMLLPANSSSFPITFIGTWPTGQDGTSEAGAYRLNLEHVDDNVVLRPVIDGKLKIDPALLNMQFAITPPLPARLSFTVTPDDTSGSIPGRISGNPTNTTAAPITNMHTITATGGVGTIYEGREQKVYIRITIAPITTTEP